jgi:cytochrome b561
MLYSVLRKAHTVLAYLFMLTFLAHFGAVLFHALIVRDGILRRMVPWNVQAAAQTLHREPGSGA